MSQTLYLEISAERPISKELKDSLFITNTFKDYSSLQKEVDTLPQKLERLGFIESKLKSLIKKNDSTYIADYLFGKKYQYIKVYYNDVFFSRKELQKIASEVTETYFILPFETTEASLQKLNVLKTEEGNAFATLNLSNLQVEENHLSAMLEFESGQKRSLDSLVVKGYENFPKSFLKYYAEDTQRLQFNGYLNLELNNNLNYGEQLLINYKSDGSDQQNFRVKATLPYLFRTPFGISGELKIFKRDSTFVTTEQQARLNYQINPVSNAYIGYKGYESSNLLDEIEVGSTVEDFNSRFFIAGASFIKRQGDALFPIKTELTLDSEIGSRELENTSEDQIKLSVLASTIFNLNLNNSIFIRNKTDVLFSETYITNELFRFGGINSIRGFNENSIDASLLSTLNTEYRYRFNSGLYIHSILDFGYFQNQTLNIEQNLYSAGIGLGIQTKAGILKLNIANGISEQQNFNFSNTKIHLSLTSKF